MLPVILFDSGIKILLSGSSDALLKQSSKVLQGKISALGSIESAAKWEYAPKVPWN